MTTKLTARQKDKLIEAAQNAITFDVEGQGQFPLDMLRYDLCWPASEADATMINMGTGLRPVRLKGLKSPTVARWASFGWKAIEVSR